MDMSNFLNEISELIYVADTTNYDLLFMNKIGKEEFGVFELQGQKCYEVLQGRKTPCDFCTNKYLNYDDFYTWEITNPLLRRHYLLKDKLLLWDGRPARVEIAFDITEKENQNWELRNALEAETMILDCVELLHSATDIDMVMNEVLKKIGEFLGAERTYLFRVNERTMDNLYEWCAEGVEPQVDNLQGMDIRLLDNWKVYFDRHECMVISDLDTERETNHPDGYEILKAQGIHSLVAAPIFQDDKLIAYIGVDNPPSIKIKNISSLLHTLGCFIAVSIQRQTAKKHLEKASYTDLLTGVMNRNAFMKGLDDIAANPVRKPLGLIYVDVNGMKEINDRYGHQQGDRILIEITKRLKTEFKEAFIFRIGGDEFVVLFYDMDKKFFQIRVEEVEKLARDDTNFCISIGHRWSDGSENIQQLIYDADEMMYAHKRDFYRRKTAAKLYRYEKTDILQSITKESLQRKIDQNKFMIQMFPRFDLQTEKVVGARTGVSYLSPEGVMIQAHPLLAGLEDAGLVNIIDFYVLEFVCQNMQQWQRRGKKVLPVSVNFSKYTFLRPDIEKELTVMVKKYGIAPDLIEIEMRDTADVEENKDIIDTVRKLRDAEFGVSTGAYGFSSANTYIFAASDINILKIDSSLTACLLENIRVEKILKFVMGACRELSVCAVAEGVENTEQAEVLKKLGCGKAEGPLYGKPLEADEFAGRYIF